MLRPQGAKMTIGRIRRTRLDKLEVTKEEFNKYVIVQSSGRFNMIDPRARVSTGLSKKVYRLILDNYSKLQRKFK